jgi:hemerythrin-like domain-containing protein
MTQNAATRGNGTTAMGDPITILAEAHAQHARLCDVLEKIADSLPDDTDPFLCRLALDQLRLTLPAHHRHEEEGLFPLLERRAQPEDNLSEHLAQLCLEHATDESFAHELGDELELLAIGRVPRNPNMVGYMLRGFFESYRRHLHWENTVVLPLARRRLTAADLEELAVVISNVVPISRG